VPRDKNNKAIAISGELYLARVVVDGDPVTMALPREEVLAKHRLPSLVLNASDKRRSIEFHSKGFTHQFRHKEGDGRWDEWRAFDPLITNFKVDLGSTEEWTLTSQGNNHPFHIHVQPFEVLGTGVQGDKSSVWRDTILVPENGREVRIRIRFDKFAGKTVLHCHNLDHEDQGMMMVVDIQDSKRKPPQKRSGLSVLPMKAPGWMLVDQDNKRYRLSDFAGTNLLLVFFRGFVCGHCLAQFQTIAKFHDAFEKAGVKLVAICPESRQDVREAMGRLPQNADFRFLFLAPIRSKKSTYFLRGRPKSFLIS
jgi:hypothetical protein